MINYTGAAYYTFHLYIKALAGGSVPNLMVYILFIYLFISVYIQQHICSGTLYRCLPAVSLLTWKWSCLTGVTTGRENNQEKLLFSPMWAGTKAITELA